MIEEKIKVLKNTLEMLKSPDHENVILGLSVLNSKEHNGNLVSLLYCYKYGVHDEDEWVTHAPEAWAFMRKYWVSRQTSLTYGRMYEALLEAVVSAEEMGVFLAIFMEHLTDKAIAAQCPIEQLDISIKLKEKVNDKG